MVSPEIERRMEFALCSVSNAQDRLEEIEERISILEYSLSLLSKRVDELERAPS
jgi:chaperonin cofactor prefoldin